MRNKTKSATQKGCAPSPTTHSYRARRVAHLRQWLRPRTAPKSGDVLWAVFESAATACSGANLLARAPGPSTTRSAAKGTRGPALPTPLSPSMTSWTRKSSQDRLGSGGPVGHPGPRTLLVGKKASKVGMDLFIRFRRERLLNTYNRQLL